MPEAQRLKSWPKVLVVQNTRVRPDPPHFPDDLQGYKEQKQNAEKSFQDSMSVSLLFTKQPSASVSVNET